MADIMKMRRDTNANWSNANPVLSEGELGFETDTKRFKLGDGVTAWNNLNYYDKLIHLTQDEYDALTEEEQMNGDWYFIEE